jgi:hypothetical protein
MKDKRQTNHVWEYCNRLGELYRFARIGSGKNSYIKTLCYLGNVISDNLLKKHQEENFLKYGY